jgi:hypothetical protein
MVMIPLHIIENTVLYHRKGTLNREKVLPLETKSTPQKKTDRLRQGRSLPCHLRFFLVMFFYRFSDEVIDY